MSVARPFMVLAETRKCTDREVVRPRNPLAIVYVVKSLLDMVADGNARDSVSGLIRNLKPHSSWISQASAAAGVKHDSQSRCR